MYFYGTGFCFGLRKRQTVGIEVYQVSKKDLNKRPHLIQRDRLPLYQIKLKQQQFKSTFEGDRRP